MKRYYQIITTLTVLIVSTAAAHAQVLEPETRYRGGFAKSNYVSPNILGSGIDPIKLNPGTITSTKLGYLADVTGPIGATLLGKQPLSSDLTCLAGLGTTGLLKRTGSGTCSAGALVVGDVPAHASTHLQGGTDPILATPTVLSGDTVLTAANRIVYVDSPLIATLPTSPPNGTAISIISGLDGTSLNMTIQRGGTNTILLNSSPLYLPLGPTGIELRFHGGDWRVTAGFHRRVVTFKWDSATVGQYLQSTDTGGALSTARVLGLLTGTIVWGELTCQTRVATSGVQSVYVCTADSALASSTCGLSVYTQATFGAGGNFATSKIQTISSSIPTSTAKSVFVAQASALNTPVDCSFAYWTL